MSKRCEPVLEAESLGMNLRISGFYFIFFFLLCELGKITQVLLPSFPHL